MAQGKKQFLSLLVLLLRHLYLLPEGSTGAVLGVLGQQ